MNETAQTLTAADAAVAFGGPPESNAVAEVTRYVHLQGVGDVAGKKLRDLKPGDRVMWNYGYTSTVVECAPVTEKTWTLKIRSDESGVEHVRRKRPDTVLAFVKPDGKITVRG